MRRQYSGRGSSDRGLAAALPSHLQLLEIDDRRGELHVQPFDLGADEAVSLLVEERQHDRAVGEEAFDVEVEIAAAERIGLGAPRFDVPVDLGVGDEVREESRLRMEEA